ncbi:NAD(P)-binding protein [Eremomyces bilateralis CBS 781.70]|uniref:NAD(P)-binding protein n=1 Tax=Eremomyces bilateralis CBS 781.70 TaxID=1392243 RepID=A0A6G1GE50_9PEZI|nr:NAD(P)-binding protein [Eremomyces bilateralis CBS 781.70]KAF1816377.1 NAD(P)-binding protein [Eremomyces bilateralis CBS 781.70]
MASFTTFVREQHKKLPLIPTTQDCTGGTYIITGSNQGLGYECAKHLIALSANKVIIAVRFLSRGDAAKAKIEAETGRKGVIEVWHLDLSSYDSVKEFVKKVETLDRVDAIIENAGIAMAESIIAEGLESTLTVNVVSTMLLAVLVLPKLQESARKFGIVPHLVLVGSEVAFQAKGELEKIDGDLIDGVSQSPMPGKRYEISKLLLLYAMREFASLHPYRETGVAINYVNPGLCNTELSRNAGWVQWLIIAIVRTLLARSAEVGSRNLLYAAVAGKYSNGKYISACEVKEDHVASWATNVVGRRIQQRVWESLRKKLNTIYSGCV